MILYRIDNWIYEGSGWIVESIDGEYVNISAYSPLVGSTYIELPDKLKNSIKGLLNIKNDDDNKRFLWCHVTHLNLLKSHPGRITKKDEEMVNKLNYEEINFPVSKKDYCRIEKQNNICVNVFSYGRPVYLSDQKFENCMQMSANVIMYISKILTDLCLVRLKIRIFCKCSLQYFSSEEILIEHKTDCLVI